MLDLGWYQLSVEGAGGRLEVYEDPIESASRLS